MKKAQKKICNGFCLYIEFYEFKSLVNCFVSNHQYFGKFEGEKTIKIFGIPPIILLLVHVHVHVHM